MPIFYSAISVYGTAFFISGFLSSVLFYLTARQRKTRIPLLLLAYVGIWSITFVASVVIVNFALHRAQANVASPYIQEAINSQCGIESQVIAPDDFYLSDGLYRWSSTDKSVTCYYSFDAWECSCE